MQDHKIEVWLGPGTGSEQRREVGEIFREEGIPVRVRTRDPLPIGNGAGFTVEVFVLGTTLGPFLAAYFGGAGKDAWEKTKELLSRLKENHKKQYPDHDMDEGLLIFKDTERRIFVGLYTHDPDEAYKKLFELDIPDEEQMSWGWNDEKGVWEATDLSEIPDMGLAPPDPTWDNESSLWGRVKRLFRR